MVETSVVPDGGRGVAGQSSRDQATLAYGQAADQARADALAARESAAADAAAVPNMATPGTHTAPRTVQ